MAITVLNKEGMELRIHESLDELETDLVEYIAQISETCVRERGSFVIALSGGSLIGFIKKLCKTPFKTTVDWGKWHVFWVDERGVSKNHVDSNFGLAWNNFILKVPINLDHIHSVNTSLRTDKGAEKYEFVIRQLVRKGKIPACDVSDCPKFDLILLEMGADGHVASLFPDDPNLAETSGWVTYTINSPESPPERITFTLPVINAASNIAILAAGASKADAVSAAVCSGSDSPSVPAKMVRPINGKLTWFMDEQAAAKVEGFQPTTYN